MPASVSDGPVRIADYEDAEARVIYKNTGPVAACCGKPYRTCTCPRTPEMPGDVTEAPSRRQATALEMIAFYLGKIVKHLEAQPEPIFVKPGAVPETITLTASDPIELPKLAIDGEQKKAELLGKLKGGLGK